MTNPTTPPPRLISLFAGVGGFDLAFERAGFTPVGMCETDAHARSVLERHWPDVPKHDDVRTLTPATFGPADVITFGSPCQDLSTAGKRAGLTGERSSLFLDAVAYIRAMLEETNGRYPAAAVWENVPGALSSNQGRDFATVLATLVGGDPRPTPDRGWPGAGVTFGPLGSAEWRILDSQHFGVPQRRRRIFLVYHPRGERAGQVLLEPDRVPGHPQARREARPRHTASAGGSPPQPGSGGPDAAHAQAGRLIPARAQTVTAGTGRRYDPDTETLLPVPHVDVMPTMRAGGTNDRPTHDPISGDTRDEYIAPVAFKPSHYTRAKDGAPSEIAPPLSADADRGDQDTLVAAPVAFKVRGGTEIDSAGKSAGKGYLGSEDKALTIGASQDQYLAEPIAFDWAAGAQHGISPARITPPLQVSGGIGRAAVTFAAPIKDGVRPNKAQNGLGYGRDGDPAYTLTTTGHEAVAFAQNSRHELRLEGGTGHRTGTLSAGGGKPGQGLPTIATTYAVRRLTPRECERLQAFPDDWTRYTADGDEIADTHRYRMMGNAVTVSVIEWIAHRLRAATRD